MWAADCVIVMLPVLLSCLAGKIGLRSSGDHRSMSPTGYGKSPINRIGVSLPNPSRSRRADLECGRDVKVLLHARETVRAPCGHQDQN